MKKVKVDKTKDNMINYKKEDYYCWPFTGHPDVVFVRST